jgi:hypothetical protein
MSIPPAYFPHFYPEDGENIVLYNMCHHLAEYAIHPPRLLISML